MCMDAQSESRFELNYGTGDVPLQVTENSPYPIIARALVFNYVQEHLDPTDRTSFEFDDVYVVSFAYVMGNYKCLLSTTLPDGMYYEVTYDRDKCLAYLDAYKRFDQRQIIVPPRRK